MNDGKPVFVLAVSCSTCGLLWDAERDGEAFPIGAKYLHDESWSHEPCGGRLSFATEVGTDEAINGFIRRLFARERIDTGLPADLVDTFNRHDGRKVRQ